MKAFIWTFGCCSGAMLAVTAILIGALDVLQLLFHGQTGFWKAYFALVVIVSAIVALMARAESVEVA